MTTNPNLLTRPGSPLMDLGRRGSSQVPGGLGIGLNSWRRMKGGMGPPPPKRRVSIFKSDKVVKDGDKGHKDGQEVELCEGLPRGLRALTVPQGLKVPGLQHSIYGCTAQWPLPPLRERSKEQDDPVLQSPRAPPQRYDDDTSLTLEALRASHSSTFRVIKESQGRPSTPTSRGGAPRSLTLQADTNTVQVYLTSPTCSEGMTMTHLFLCGTNIGDIVLYQTTELQPVEPLRPSDLANVVDGDYERPPPDADQQVIRGDKMTIFKGGSDSLGWKEFRVVSPKRCVSALLIILMKTDDHLNTSSTLGASLGWRKLHQKVTSENASQATLSIEGSCAGTKWKELSPFFLCSFHLDGVKWTSSEHYYQAMKFNDGGLQQDVANAETAETATALGKQLGPIRADWLEAREDIMYAAMKAKFEQNQDCKKVLLSTGTKKLLFPNGKNPFWCSRSSDSTEPTNIYGYLLEKLRSEFQSEETRRGLRRTAMALQLDSIEVVGYDSLVHPVTSVSSKDLLRVKERVVTPLYLSVLQNDVEAVRRQVQVIKTHHDINVVEAVLRAGLPGGTASGSTCLHAAAKLGHVEILKILLQHGADPQIQNDRLSTPLHAAARSGHTECMELLLRDKNGHSAAMIMDCVGSTPLMVAVESRKKAVIRQLLSLGSEVTDAVRVSDNATLMHIAAKRLDVSTLLLLKDHKEHATYVTVNNETPLHWAFKGGKENDEDKLSDLKMQRVGEKQSKVIDVLLEYGADLRGVTDEGVNAMHLAAENGSELGLSALLKAAGENWHDLLYQETDDGYTPLMKAGKMNHIGTMSLILTRRWNARGGTTSFVQSGGWNEMNLMQALVVAAEAGHNEVLTEFGPRVQLRAFTAGYDWSLALLLAAENGNTEIMRFLLGKEVLPNARLFDGHPEQEKFGDATPLLIASKKADHEIVNMLLEQADNYMSKADILEWFTCRHNMRGHTPLLAAIHAFEEMGDAALQTVDLLLAFAKICDININTMNIGQEDPWLVICNHGVEIELDDPTAAGRKIPVAHGSEVGVIEIVNDYHVHVASPHQGWITIDDPTSPPIAQMETPLHAAVSTKSKELVMRILNHCNVDAKMLQVALEQPDKRSLTPLLLATSMHLPDISKILVEKGADPNAKNINQETVVHILAKWPGRNSEAVMMLECFSEKVLKNRAYFLSPVEDYQTDTIGYSVGYSTTLDIKIPAARSVLVDLLLCKSKPFKEQGAMTALETACTHGAVAVADWILQQYHFAKSYLSAEQMTRVEVDNRRGFEFAAKKLPLHRDRDKLTTSFVIPNRSASVRNTPGEEEHIHFAAIVNLMFQAGVPIPLSIMQRPDVEMPVETEWLAPLEMLFSVVLELEPTEFPSEEENGKKVHRLILPLHQQWMPDEQGDMVRCTTRSDDVLLALSRALEMGGIVSFMRKTKVGQQMIHGARRLTSGRIPFQEVEILQVMKHEILEKENVRTRFDFVLTQNGVHVQVQLLRAVADEIRIRFKKDKKLLKIGYLWHYNTSSEVLKIDTTSDVLSFAFFYVDDMETFQLAEWVQMLIDDEILEYNIDNGWFPLGQALDTCLDESAPMVNQVHSLQAIIRDPYSCDRYDHFFKTLSRKRGDDAFELFEEPAEAKAAEERLHDHAITLTTSAVMSQTLMTFLQFRVVQQKLNPLRLLDVTGVILEPEHEDMLEKWIGAPNGVFSNLQLLRFNSRRFGPIEVTPKLGEEASEVRPLHSLAADNFTLDLKFITCTARDDTPRVEFIQQTESTKLYKDFPEDFDKEDQENILKAEEELKALVDIEDMQNVLSMTIERLREQGVRWRSLRDIGLGTDEEFEALSLKKNKQKVQRKAAKEAERLLQTFGNLGKESYVLYFSAPKRYDVLLKLMNGKRQKTDTVNEIFDRLGTGGRGIQIDLGLFQSAEGVNFQFGHVKALLEYVKRHKAVRSLRFTDLNFLNENEENQEAAVREFIQAKLLRGLTCRNIDFGKENKHVGEIFMTTATFNPGEEEDVIEAQPGDSAASPQLLKNFDTTSEGTIVMSSLHSKRPPTQNHANQDADAATEGGLTPLHYFKLEGVSFFVTDTLRRYPIHFLLKLLAERRNELDDDSEAGSLHPSPRLPEHSHENIKRMKKEQHNNLLSVIKKTIQFLNSRDPFYFLKWVHRKCEGITPLRLAIHLQLDDIVECMIGLQKTQGGLLKRKISYDPERLEMDHFVDIWGCREPDNEGLLPLHAAILQVGVVDYVDNVATGGRWEVTGENGEELAVPRHKRPYRVRNYYDGKGMKITNPLMAYNSADGSLAGDAMMLPIFLMEDENSVAFRHPSNLPRLMSEIHLLHERRKLVTYVDTSVDADTTNLGDGVNRSIKLLKQLIACSFVERSIIVGGNPPPRGCKQYIEIPKVIDRADRSILTSISHKTQKVMLSRTWDRTGVNENVLMRDGAIESMSGTALHLALKFAPYVVPNLLTWGDLIELEPTVRLSPSWLGIIHLQYRKGFKSVNIQNDVPMLGQITWEEEDSELNLAHWAAVRDQKRLLERVVQENPECMSQRTKRLERTALHYACYSGSLECLNVLLSALSDKTEGTGVHTLDVEGNTPLHISASLCHPICTETLLEAGARPYWKNKKSSGGLDPHDCSIALLLHHTHKEKDFHKENLAREWERDATILKNQISLLNQDPRIQRKLSLQATKSFLLEASFYLLFLTMLCMVVHNKTGLFSADGYFKTAGVREEVLHEEFSWNDTRFVKRLEDVSSVEDMYSFLRGPVIDQMFIQGNGGSEFATLFGLLRLVGTVRLRQLRVKDMTCHRPNWVNTFISGCYGAWSTENEETSGTHFGSAYISQREDPAVYGWRSKMNHLYPNDGYAIDLFPTDIFGSLKTLQDLEDRSWVDLQTRAVFVEFTLYNPNVHTFMVGKVLFETPEYGGCHSSYRLTNVRIEWCLPGGRVNQLECQSTYDEVIFFLELCLLVSVVFLTYDELFDMWNSWKYVQQMIQDEEKRRMKESKEREQAGQRVNRYSKLSTPSKPIDDTPCSRKVFNFTAYLWHGLAHYFWREWNLVDLLSVIMFWLVAGTRFSFINETMHVDPEDLIADNSTFLDLWPIAALTRAERELWALVLVLYVVKLLKYIMILPKLGSVATAITTTIGDSKVLIFFVVFMVITLSLMLGIHLLLSESSLGYKSFGDTLLSFMQIVFGQWDYNSFTRESWLIGPFLFLCTLFLANLVLINVFIAVVGNIYEENLRKSVERWSWQIIDEYQYKLTKIPRPRGTGNPVMAALSKLFFCWLRVMNKVVLRNGRKEDAHGLHDVTSENLEEFPTRVMRKEAVQRLLKSQQRIQTNLAEVNENVDSVKHKVLANTATLDRIHEQLDKLDSSMHHLQSSHDELRLMVISNQVVHS